MKGIKNIMLLSMDIGNTFTSIGIHENKNIINHFYLKTNTIKTEDEIAIFLLNLLKFNKIIFNEIDSAIISSVVPSKNKIIINSIKKYFKIDPFFVNLKMNLGINLNVENPKEVGTDLITDAVSADYNYGGNCIIVNCGTAIKFSMVNDKSEFLGVIIVPGYEISKKALFKKTSLLPFVEFSIPKKNNIIGKNSIEAIQNGLYYGYKGLILNLIDLIKKNNNKKLKVILSGGAAKYFEFSLKKYIDIIDYDLTLKGLNIIYEKNKN